MLQADRKYASDTPKYEHTSRHWSICDLDLWHTTCGIRLVAYDLWHTTCGIRLVAYDLWPVTFPKHLQSSNGCRIEYSYTIFKVWSELKSYEAPILDRH
jgi:hypothetical protein